MKVIEYFNSDRQAHWLSRIKKSDWRAGQYLYKLLDEGKLQDAVGENAKVLLSTEWTRNCMNCTYQQTIQGYMRSTDLHFSRQ